MKKHPASGGSRTGHVYRNLFITMLLGGLWHGAAGHFVAWGAYHGMLLALHRRGHAIWAKLSALFGDHDRRWRVACILVMFHLTCLGWILFRASSLSDALTITSSLARVQMLTAPQARDALTLAFLVLPLVSVQMLKERSESPDYIFQKAPMLLRANAAVYCALMVIFWSSHRDIPFIYFQF